MLEVISGDEYKLARDTYTIVKRVENCDLYVVSQDKEEAEAHKAAWELVNRANYVKAVEDNSEAYLKREFRYHQDKADTAKKFMDDYLAAKARKEEK